ncbi:uncharacterized protein LOC144301038 [Canis aureus]
MEGFIELQWSSRVNIDSLQGPFIDNHHGLWWLVLRKDRGKIFFPLNLWRAESGDWVLERSHRQEPVKMAMERSSSPGPSSSPLAILPAGSHGDHLIAGFKKYNSKRKII